MCVFRFLWGVDWSWVGRVRVGGRGDRAVLFRGRALSEIPQPNAAQGRDMGRSAAAGKVRRATNRGATMRLAEMAIQNQFIVMRSAAARPTVRSRTLDVLRLRRGIVVEPFAYSF